MSAQVRFNSKRRIIDPRPQVEILSDLARRIKYVGHPQHKRNPGDFALTPPAQPRPDKTLCDLVGIFRVAEAQQWLEAGARRGMVSENLQDGFPKHIWAVTDTGIVLEAKYSNVGPGHYHGYPLFEPDPFRQVVIARWRQNE